LGFSALAPGERHALAGPALEPEGHHPAPELDDRPRQGPQAARHHGAADLEAPYAGTARALDQAGMLAAHAPTSP